MAAQVGFLPFYLALYDEVAPQNRSVIEDFYTEVAQELQNKGLIVKTAPVCRLANEFMEAVHSFEDQGVDALMTIHLAYSPSLESLPALISTKLPIVIINTTVEFDFGFEQDPSAITFNHGIHGVQDICSMLVRNKREFFIETGHWKYSTVIDRAANIVRGIAAAKAFNHARVGTLGSSFKGMGDFFVTPKRMEQDFDIALIPFPEEYAMSNDSSQEEIAYLQDIVDFSDIPEDVLEENIHVTKTLRTWTQDQKLTAFTCNFRDVTSDAKINRVPFLYAGIGMYEGIGYAGEGDVLTAALAGAMLSINRETTFTEMFCPDWKGSRIFLSHMGEINPRICRGKAVLSAKPYTYSSALQPLFITGEYRHGNALLVNLIPLLKSEYRLIICSVTLEESTGGTGFKDTVRGWMRPQQPIEDFLSEYSRLGGTHHSVLVYDESIETVTAFGQSLGWDVRIID